MLNPFSALKRHAWEISVIIGTITPLVFFSSCMSAETMTIPQALCSSVEFHQDAVDCGIAYIFMY